MQKAIEALSLTTLSASSAFFKGEPIRQEFFSVRNAESKAR
jgi:hypothetical protein